MGADYSFYVKNIETHARAFFKVIIFSISSVTVAVVVLCFLFVKALQMVTIYSQVFH